MEWVHLDLFSLHITDAIPRCLVSFSTPLLPSGHQRPRFPRFPTRLMGTVSLPSTTFRIILGTFPMKASSQHRASLFLYVSPPSRQAHLARLYHFILQWPTVWRTSAGHLVCKNQATGILQPHIGTDPTRSYLFLWSGNLITWFILHFSVYR